MVFQRPNPFPTMSILDNVTSGLRFNGIRNRALMREAAESALRHAALWDIVKDRLDQPARAPLGRSAAAAVHRPGPGGRARRAVDGRALLGPRPHRHRQDRGPHHSTSPSEVTIVLVTHNMFQAARVSDNAAVFLLDEDRVGELVEVGPTVEIFDSP